MGSGTGGILDILPLRALPRAVSMRERLKAQEPEMLAQAKRIEDNDWGTWKGSNQL
jgi:hypothetical protein